MKKALPILISVFLMSVITAWGKDGDKFYVNGVRYQVLSEADKTCQVGWGDKFSNYTKAVTDDWAGDIVIPTHANSYKVVSVNDMAFRVLPNVTSVTIPYTVTHIGKNAFYNSKNLKTVKLNCGNLDIPYYPLSDNTIVQNVILGDSVKEVGPEMFKGCTALKSVTMSQNVTRIDYRAFQDCSSLKSITLPSSLDFVSLAAFQNSGLRSISIPGSVTWLAVDAFKGCTYLSEVRFESGDDTIYTGTSTESSSKSIIMFADCPLNNVYINRNIKLGTATYSPFRNNNTLTTVTLGTQVKELPEGAFYGCKALERFIATNESVSASKGVNAIPPIVEILWYAPLRNIPKDAFYGCTSLNSIVLPTTVTEIMQNAFYSCKAMKSINLPEGLTAIRSRAFYQSGIEKVTIPGSLRTIEENCFALSALRRFNIKDGYYSTRASLGNNVFYGCSELDSVFLASSMTIGTGLFRDCTSLKAVKLPSLLTAIPSQTFQGCRSLEEYDIHTYNYHLTSIGSNAFNGCLKLSYVSLVDFITNIGDNAFQNCQSLKALGLPSNLKTIAQNLFAGCTSLEKVGLPDSLTTISSQAFYNCSALSALTIPNSVTSIGKNIFYGCTGLRELISFSSAYIDYIPSSPCVALMAPAVISRYNAANVRPLVTVDATQTTITLGSTSDFFLNSARKITDVSSTYSENGKVKLTDFAPDRGQKVHIVGNAFGRDVWGDIVVSTLPLTLDIELLKATNLTLRVRGISNSGDATVTSSGFVNNNESGNETLITGLYPGQSVNVTFSVTTADGSKTNYSKTFRTVPVTASVSATPGVTSCVLNGSYSVIDATVTDYGFKDNSGKKQIKVNGLDPKTSYSYEFYVRTKEGGRETASCTFTTKALSITTLQPKVISMGNVIVAAKTNIDDDEQNVGFEWRRTDWTTDFQSNSGTAYLYDGEMEGYIRNLNTEKLWKYRPFYISSSGKGYYGDWVGLDPTNTSYFEPTVHTYANVVVSGNTAQVKGYAMRGTDNITTQGFKYWRTTANSRGIEPEQVAFVPSGAKTVTATGNVMEVQLNGLQYETTYSYVAFVTTSSGETFYGAERQFTTGSNITAIEQVVQKETEAVPVAYYDMNGRRLNTKPNDGMVIVKMSDGSTRKLFVKGGL